MPLCLSHQFSNIKSHTFVIQATPIVSADYGLSEVQFVWVYFLLSLQPADNNSCKQTGCILAEDKEHTWSGEVSMCESFTTWPEIHLFW